MTIIKHIVFVKFLFLVACISTTDRHVLQSSSPSTVDKLIISYPVKSYLWTEPLYYISFHREPHDKWRLVSVTSSPIGNHLAEEEYFIVSSESNFAQPAFTKTNISRSGSTFVCRKGGHMSSRHLKEPYNGCNSMLVKSRLTLENLWGKDIVVALDKEKVRSIFRETKVIEHIKNCKTMRWKWESFRYDIKVQLPVIDENDMYKYGKLAQYTVQPDPLNCMNDIADQRYKVTVTPYKFSQYIIDIAPNKVNLKYNSSGHTVISKITVKGKWINYLNVGDTYHDNVVGLELIAAKQDGRLLKFSYKLHNKSASYVLVDTVSFYVGKDIFSEIRKIPYSLPPNSSSDILNSLIEPGTERYKRAKKHITLILTQDDIKSKTVELGASLQYEFNGKQHTLYGKKVYSYERLFQNVSRSLSPQAKI